MELGPKLDELNLTSDEVSRFSNAFKDEKFREMLREYAEEISNPETRKKYEEEITQLERERGVHAQFVHPQPHHALKVTQAGAGKCFVNVCSNELIGEPSCKSGRGEDGSVGQYWSLPYSLSPGRADRDVRGNQHVIYDVVFHPDTLYIAGKCAKFMKLVNSTALQGITDAFKVQLDKGSVKLLRTNYKGQPQPAIIRKRIPDYSDGEKESREPFPFPYPDTTKCTSEGNPATPTHTPVQSSPDTKQPTTPHYTIKYRSEIDLQDYRCSRDSAPSPRPKEIIITIDLPALVSARDVDLNVTERGLILESEKPAYRLELRLYYPVDEDKGHAKFDKAKKQLTVTLPVLPASRPPVVHLEERQTQSEDEDDERENANHDAVPESEVAPGVKLSETNLSGSACDAQGLDDRPVKEEDEENECLDALLTWDKANTESPKVVENVISEPDDCCSPGQNTGTPKMHSEHLSYEETDLNNPTEEQKHHSDTEVSDENDTAPDKPKQDPLTPDNIADALQHSFTEDESGIEQAVSSLEKTPPKVPSGHSDLSTQLTGASAVEFDLEKSSVQEGESMMTAFFTEEQPDVLHGGSPQNSHTEAAPLTEEIEEQLEAAENACHFEQSQNDLDAGSPTILRERNPEDGSEIVISDHVTAAALSFQNSICFELD